MTIAQFLSLVKSITRINTMNVYILIVLVASCLIISYSFQINVKGRVKLGLRMSESGSTDRASRRAARQAEMTKGLDTDTPSDIVGEDIPLEVQNLMKEPIYDMILVERYSAPPKTVGGIILPPGPEGADRRKLAKVLAIPKLGLESEQGRVQPMSELVRTTPDLKVGDRVYLQDDWGIGPKNIEIGTRKFSFHKANHVIGVVR